LKNQLEAKDNVLKTNNEKLNELQSAIDEQTTTVEGLNRAVEILCGDQQYVSTCKIEALTISKLTEIPAAINTANLRTNDLVC
jgi:hypothetical protein